MRDVIDGRRRVRISGVCAGLARDRIRPFGAGGTAGPRVAFYGVHSRARLGCDGGGRDYAAISGTASLPAATGGRTCAATSAMSA